MHNYEYHSLSGYPSVLPSTHTHTLNVLETQK